MEKGHKLSKLLESPAVKELLTLFDNQNTIRLAAELIDTKTLTADEVANLLSVSRSTAFRYLNQLEDAGLVGWTWEVSRSSAPKAVKKFSLTERGKIIIDMLLKAFSSKRKVEAVAKS